MAQASGFTTNYVDPRTGLRLPEAWIEIDSILYRPYNYVLITVNIYQDLSSYQTGKAPILSNIQNQIGASTPDWTAYFDPDTMDQALHNIQRESINWLQVNLNN